VDRDSGQSGERKSNDTRRWPGRSKSPVNEEGKKKERGRAGGKSSEPPNSSEKKEGPRGPPPIPIRTTMITSGGSKGNQKTSLREPKTSGGRQAAKPNSGAGQPQFLWEKNRNTSAKSSSRCVLPHNLSRHHRWLRGQEEVIAKSKPSEKKDGKKERIADAADKPKNAAAQAGTIMIPTLGEEKRGATKRANPLGWEKVAQYKKRKRKKPENMVGGLFG